MPKRKAERMPGQESLARAHGAFNLVGGAWPLLCMRSFEWVFGPKRDRWLVATVAGLLVTVGWAQLRSESSPGGLAQARRIGVGTAATLLAVDLVNVPRGRLRWTYLLDAAMEIVWLRAWARAKNRE